MSRLGLRQVRKPNIQGAAFVVDPPAISTFIETKKQVTNGKQTGDKEETNPPLPNPLYPQTVNKQETKRVTDGPLISKQTVNKRMRSPTIVVRGEVLLSWMTVSDYNRSQLARELGVSNGRVSQLLASPQEPSAHLIAKLMLLTHLPFERLFTLLRDASSSASARSVKTVQGLVLK